jgi:ribosomal protein S12 methylthiotransferase
MRVRSLHPKKINIVTLGCSKNLVDSEVLMSQLKANDFDVSHQSEKNNSEIVVINTCGFIENAKQESIDTILQYVEEKEAGRIEKLYVTGCLSHRYKDELEKEIPQVDAYFGTLELPRILQTLGADYKHDLLGERITTTPQHYSYLKISEGCNRPCSFCAIPLMRGKHVSKTIEQLVLEAKNLVKNGTKELILIAQDSTYYGLDIYGNRKLADLLKALSDVEGVGWIRLHYAFPSQFPMDVLKVMGERENICNYLDIPLQHITDHMLKTMRRGISESRSRKLIEDIRTQVPGIALRTTMLVGHPGETTQEFEKLCRFVEEAKFDRLGVFTYSHEENTHAHKLADDVPHVEKERRAAELMEIQQQVASELNEAYVGQTLKVLFDRKESGYFVGRTEYDSPEVDNEVLVETVSNFVRLGDFANIEITSSGDFDLYGKLAAEQ